MQNRLLYLVKFILEQVWQLFRLPFPGTDVPIIALLAFPVVVGFVVRFLRNMFGVGGLGSASSNISHLRSKDD